MSDLVFRRFDTEEIIPTASNTSSEENDKKIFAAKFILIILSAVLLIEAVVYLLVMPCLGQAKISWTGVDAETVQKLNLVAGDALNENWLSFDEVEVCSLLCSVPEIEDVQIEKVFPDKISINVTKREGVAVTFISQNNRTVPMLIDRNGVIFQADGKYDFDSSTLLLSGIPVENIPEGMRIPSKYHTLLQQISQIKSVNKDYFAAVSEIHVVPKEYGNYELVLYPINSRIRILTDRALNEEALQYMMVMVDVVGSIEKNVEEIDLRYGAVSYRTHQSSGEVRE